MLNENLLEEIIRIVKAASKLCFAENLDIESKGGNSNFVTSADVAVEKYLYERLPLLIEGSQMLGEEGTIPDKSTEYIWVVDPIDGTANFIRQFNLSAISVGLLHKGIPEIGVVYNPFTDELYTGQPGKGTFLNGQPVRVSDRDYAHSTICTAFSLYDKSLAKPCFEILEEIYPDIDDMRRLGTAAIELSDLAAGKCELYFEIRLFPWDAAAACAMIREAGGFYEIIGFGQEIPLDRPFSVIAANSKSSLDKLGNVVKKYLQLHNVNLQK